MLEKILQRIEPADQAARLALEERWKTKAHPIGSLGQLEFLTARLGAILRTEEPVLDKRALIVMAGDNGIAQEGVTSGHRELTSQLLGAMGHGKTGACALATWAKMEVFPVDLGTFMEQENEKIIKKRNRPCSSNFLKEPALTDFELENCLLTGYELVGQLVKDGYKIFGTGELGIGNTTTSAALLAALTGHPPEDCVGLGGGIDRAQLKKKADVVAKGIELYKGEGVLELLRCLGGYDLAGLVGVFLGGAAYQRPVIIDGFISAVAALVATRIEAKVRDYLIPGHYSMERQVGLVYQELEIKPILDLDMRLGEGSGTLLVLAMLDAGLYALKNMGTFEETGVVNSLVDISGTGIKSEPDYS